MTSKTAPASAASKRRGRATTILIRKGSSAMNDTRQTDQAGARLPAEPPRPGETCSCGRDAYVVYLTEKWGRVGWCGRPNEQHDINEPSILAALAALAGAECDDRPEPRTADEYIAQCRDIEQEDLTRDLTGARDAAVNAVVLMAQGAEGLDAADLKVMQALAESVYYLGVLAEHAADGELVDVTLREDELRDAFERIMAAKARSDA